MNTARIATPFSAVRAAATRLTGGGGDYDTLLDAVGDRSLVLLGEATHGSSEFYRMRAEITQRLVIERSFDAVVVEADWPDAVRVNRYIRGDGHDTSVDAALGAFQRFPMWMWRNVEVGEFVSWLCTHNAGMPRTSQVGFLGMDLYSLYRSADAIVEYLGRADPEQAEAARRIFECLDHARDPQEYGFAATHGLRRACRDELVHVLRTLRRRSDAYVPEGDPEAMDECFYAERNAQVVVSAEAYYRAMFESRVSSWNLRDDHMTGTLFAIQNHLRRSGRAGKLVVWAHNSHLGDARATEMGWGGEHNVGQLVRERGETDDALLIGFTTYAGHVAAAHHWGGEAERHVLRPALDESCEALFRRSGLDRFYLPLDGHDAEPLRAVMLQRAVGVVYRPESERASHYFRTSLPQQFDAVFHLDETEAVHPLDAAEESTWERT